MITVYSCSCKDNFYGKHCENSAWGFHELSYMTFPSLDSSTNDISIIFSSVKHNSLLAYSYGPQTGGRSDYIALELIDGNPKFSFGGRRTAYTQIDSSKYVADGKWYKITGIRNGRVSTEIDLILIQAVQELVPKILLISSIRWDLCL